MHRASMQLRLPEEIKRWLVKQAERNGSSQNSEVVRAVRERMERVRGNSKASASN